MRTGLRGGRTFAVFLFGTKRKRSNGSEMCGNMKGRYNRMRTTVLLAVIAGWAWTFEANKSEPLCVRGIEGRIAVYAATNTPREAVAWLPSDTVLTVSGELTDGPWVSIEPPNEVSVWIYRELVRDGQVLADKSQVRAGAGMTYRPIASLDRGDQIKVRGVYGDWLKIKPPPGTCFWVLRDQVEPLATPLSDESESPMTDVFSSMLDALTNETATLSVTNRARELSSLEARSPKVTPSPPPELTGFVLEEVAGQGQKVVLKGTLDWGGMSSISAPFSLVARQADGDMIPVCHLLAPELTYGPHIGAPVTIEGTRWLVKGSNIPFVIPQTLHIGE